MGTLQKSLTLLYTLQRSDMKCQPYDKITISILPRKKMFYNAQYGFGTEHPTEFASLELIDRVIVEMDKKHTSINIFLDLSKAFDTLDHTILLEKLKYYGIAAIAYKLMESYITNRKHYVEINGTKSKLFNISTGVPQGSILGPLLFIIYIYITKLSFYDANISILKEYEIITVIYNRKTCKLDSLRFCAPRGYNSLGDPTKSLKEEHVLKYKMIRSLKHQPCS